MSDPTNLSQKFAALQKLMTDQHQALMDEITALRGTGGPETTIRSLNQSLWNLAGTAPGANLLQILDEITALRGTGGPETTIRSLNQSLWNLAGTAPGASLLEIKTAIAALDSGISSVASNTSGVASNTSTLSNTKDLIVRLLAQFDTAVAAPTMKDLLLNVDTNITTVATNTTTIASNTGTIATNTTTIASNTGTIATNTGEIAGNTGTIAGNTGNPLNTLPPGVCASPLVSTGTFYQDTTAISITPVTIATWPETLGGDFTVDFDIITAGYTTVHCANWTNYHIYVASKADSFGVIPGRGERYACNQWVTLSIPESGLLNGAEFNVDRGNSLKVYICPIEDPNVLGGCAGGDGDPLVAGSWTSGYANRLYPAIYNGGITWTQNVDIVPYRGGDISDPVNAQHMTIFAIVDTPTSRPQVCVRWRYHDTPFEPSAYLYLEEYIIPGPQNTTYPGLWRGGSGGTYIMGDEYGVIDGYNSHYLYCNPTDTLYVGYAIFYQSSNGSIPPDVTITLMP